MSKWNDGNINTEHADKLISVVIQKHNTKQAIFTLPTEMLSMIFTHCIVERADVAGSLEWGSPYGWMDVILVCRWWRKVALGDPALWSHIVDKFHLPDCFPDVVFRHVSLPTIERQLMLSKRHPLSAELTADGTPSSRAILTGISRPRVRDRLRDLTLYVYHPLNARGVPPEIWESGIRRLTLKSVTTISPPAFLDPARGGLVHMDSLSTLNINLSVDHFILRPSLKHLCLWFSWNRPWRSDFKPLADLLLIIEKLPNLETLWLSKVVGDPKPIPEDNKPIELANLRELKIADCPEAIIQILRHLSFPPTTQLELKLEVDETSSNPLDSVGHQLQETLEGLHFGPSKRPYLTTTTIKSTRLEVMDDRIAFTTYTDPLHDFPLHALKTKVIITIPMLLNVLVGNEQAYAQPSLILPLGESTLREIISTSDLSVESRLVFWISRFDQGEILSAAHENRLLEFIRQRGGTLVDTKNDILSFVSLMDFIS